MDGGRTWENISDGFFGGSIGAVEVAKSDPNVIYVGGGEKTLRGNVSSGYGIWKTEDAGKTWRSVGLKIADMFPVLEFTQMIQIQSMQLYLEIFTNLHRKEVYTKV